VARKLRTARGVHAEIAGRIALDGGHYPNGFPGCPDTLGHVDQLPLLLVEHGVERVVIAPDGHDQERVLGAIRLIKAMGVKVSVLPQLLEVVGSSATFDDVDGLALLGVRRYGLSASSAFLKRTMDVTGAVAGILFMAPLLAAIAIAIKVDTRGPVFFRQRRIGRGGREFMMIKFRSMVTEAELLKDDLRAMNEAEGLFKIAEDPRVTRVGRFLRKTSLDELPQLFNVLRGDMSLVGPRPLVPDEDALIEGWQRRRASLQPGMTGLWQIFGSARIPMEEMVKIDYLYGANWSLWLDFKILLRTLQYVATKQGM
jgi:exopolysaccharide biosynthesis polyprenyl glycosylphosphotransferase